MSLDLGLEHCCPWPREGLSSERLSLASDFFCVLGLGLEPCVLDSTSGMQYTLIESSHISVTAMISGVIGNSLRSSSSLERFLIRLRIFTCITDIDFFPNKFLSIFAAWIKLVEEWISNELMTRCICLGKICKRCSSSNSWSFRLWNEECFANNYCRYSLLLMHREK